MEHKSEKRSAIFVLNDPTAPRLNPELAKEIGLNESLLFLQLEFWLRQSGTLQEDKQYWIYESVNDIQDVFSFWSRATVNRVIHSLIDQELLQVGNWNKHKYDRTRWFTLNREGINRLKSIKVFDWWVSQNETGPAQNETRSAQDETTIPDLSPDLSPDKEGADAPPSQDADLLLFLGTEETPEPRAITSNLPEHAEDDLDLTAKTQKTRDAEKVWTVPPIAGGDDPWGAPLQAFCLLFPRIEQDKKPAKTLKKWSAKIALLAEEVHASPGEGVAAIKTMAQDPSCAWLVSRSTTPYHPSWAEAFQNTLCSTEDEPEPAVETCASQSTAPKFVVPEWAR